MRRMLNRPSDYVSIPAQCVQGLSSFSSFSSFSWRRPLALTWADGGVIWRFIWSQTGEEAVAGQIRGLVEVAGNLIRQPLAADSLAPIDHKAAIPYGINTFLEQEVEGPKIEAMLRMIREAGFVWLRQEFPWEDLEVDGRGQFSDSKHDRDGDGAPDTISTWTKYDRIVDLDRSLWFAPDGSLEQSAGLDAGRPGRGRPRAAGRSGRLMSITR